MIMTMPVRIRVLFLAAACFTAATKEVSAGLLKKVLIYDKPGWYVHPDIGVIDAHLKKMGADNGFLVDVTSKPTDFNAAKLAGYQVVILNNISEMGTSIKDPSQRTAFQQWIENGGGVVAFHGSGVVRGTWDWFIKALGTDWYYDASMQAARVFIPEDARALPISEGLPLEGRITEEWNNFKVNVDTLPGTTVVLGVDETTYDATWKKHPDEGNGVKGFKMADAAGRWVHPVSWLRAAGKGRIFYSSIGHDIQSVQTSFATGHFLRAIRWAAGDLGNGPVGTGWPGMAGKPAASGISIGMGGRIEVTGAGSFSLELRSLRGTLIRTVSGTAPSQVNFGAAVPRGVYQVRLLSASRPLHLDRVVIY